MSMLTSLRFEMRRLTESDWLILDNRFDRTDVRHTVACVSQMSGLEVDVVWLRAVAVPRRYATAVDVLEAVQHALSPSQLRAGDLIRTLFPSSGDSSSPWPGKAPPNTVRAAVASVHRGRSPS